MPFTFKFRLVPFIAACIVAAIGISLGQWQLRRAAEKQAIEESMTAREAMPPLEINAVSALPPDVEYRRVRIRGEFDPGWPVYLDNRPYQGRAGFYLVMPLRIEGTNRYVLVARGWLPRDNADRTRLPSISVPAGSVVVEGRATGHLPRVMQLGEAPFLKPGAIVQNFDIKAFAAAARMDILPIIVEQTNDADDKLVRDWPKPSSGIDKHRGYAVQWFGLAVAAVLFFIVTGFRRGRS